MNATDDVVGGDGQAVGGEDCSWGVCGGYIGFVAVLAWVCFGSLRDHGIEIDDLTYLHYSASSDLWALLRAEKYLAGRPVVEVCLWLGFQVWGPNVGAFHLFVVVAHSIASLLLAWTCRQMGAGAVCSMFAGLFFLLNVAHFRAVQWISAVAYPLALIFCLLAIVGLLRYASGRHLAWAVLGCCSLFCGVLSHPAAGISWAFWFYLAYRFKLDAVAAGKMIAGGGVVLAANAWLLAVYYRHAPQVAQSATTEDWTDIWRVLAWCGGRLLTTAHWLPVDLDTAAGWELGLGVLLWAALLFLVWKAPSQIAVWSVWTMLALLPFLTRPFDLLLSIPAGPSRYLYLASAGSACIFAWGTMWSLDRLRMRWSWRGVCVGIVGLGGVLASSLFVLKRSEAVAYYMAGGYAYNRALAYPGYGDVASPPFELYRGIGQLQKALRANDRIVPMDRAYYRLASLLIHEGRDALPMIEEGLVAFPENIELKLARGVVLAEGGQADRGLAIIQAVEQGVGNSRMRLYGALADLYLSLGRGQSLQGDYNSAADAYAKAIHYDRAAIKFGQVLGERRFAVLAHLGMVYLQAGKARKAVEVFEGLLRFKLNDGWAGYYSGVAHVQLRAYDRARDHAERLRGQDAARARELLRIIAARENEEDL